jgi:hypothetical protein
MSLLSTKAIDLELELLYYSIRSVQKFRLDTVADAADDALSKVTHRDVAGIYA